MMKSAAKGFSMDNYESFSFEELNGMEVIVSAYVFWFIVVY